MAYEEAIEEDDEPHTNSVGVDRVDEDEPAAAEGTEGDDGEMRWPDEKVLSASLGVVSADAAADRPGAEQAEGIFGGTAADAARRALSSPRAGYQQWWRGELKEQSALAARFAKPPAKTREQLAEAKLTSGRRRDSSPPRPPHLGDMARVRRFPLIAAPALTDAAVAISVASCTTTTTSGGAAVLPHHRLLHHNRLHRRGGVHPRRGGRCGAHRGRRRDRRGRRRGGAALPPPRRLDALHHAPRDGRVR